MQEAVVMDKGIEMVFMNGEPLPQPNGFPLQLIAPGW
jgi:DMSO/TMAO reductase YedYZ molybdopterin-dependent catalytic subunit